MCLLINGYIMYNNLYNTYMYYNTSYVCVCVCVNASKMDILGHTEP